MDIILTDSALRKFLDTPADPDTLSQNLSLCGPTFDRIHKKDDDFIYDIEVITNRIDTASAQGIAREAAVILSQFGIPAKMINDPYKVSETVPKNHSKQFEFVPDNNLVVRFTAISLENVTIKKSPEKTIRFLENVGQRSINNCIDITNELTVLYGMPSHIFDLDKLAAQRLTIRESEKGETITTLDGKKNLLRGGDIVIEDGSGRLVDLCGIMGGHLAEVDNHTKNILLIVPVYNHQKIRKTSLYLQNRTLAAQIYEKQPDPELCLPVMTEAVKLLKERAGAQVSSGLYDHYPKDRLPKLISLDLAWLSKFVGVDLEEDQVISILSNLGFGGSVKNGQILCSVPSWRYEDINIKEDLAEEVARIYGYFRLPPVLPCVNLTSELPSVLLDTEKRIKNYLSCIGYTEIYNSSLISLDLLETFSIPTDQAFVLKNALSRDFEFLRTSLVPSILSSLKHNQGKIETIQIYEVANCYLKSDKTKVPKEISHLVIADGDIYLNAKGKLESLLKHINVGKVTFKKSTSSGFFHPSATADIFLGKDRVGSIGLIQPSILRGMQIEANPTVIEIDLTKLIKEINPLPKFEIISQYPLKIEDLTVESKRPLGEIIETIFATSKLIKDVVYLESFKNKHSFRISFGSMEKNLNQTDIDSLKEIILNRLKV